MLWRRCFSQLGTRLSCSINSSDVLLTLYSLLLLACTAEALPKTFSRSCRWVYAVHAYDGLATGTNGLGSLSFADCLLECTRENSYLATVRTVYEYGVAYNVIKNVFGKGFMIGANRFSDNTYRWRGGNPTSNGVVLFSGTNSSNGRCVDRICKFASGQPTVTALNESVLVMNGLGLWNSIRDGTASGCLCEKRSIVCSGSLSLTREFSATASASESHTMSSTVSRTASITASPTRTAGTLTITPSRTTSVTASSQVSGSTTRSRGSDTSSISRTFSDEPSLTPTRPSWTLTQSQLVGSKSRSASGTASRTNLRSETHSVTQLARTQSTSVSGEPTVTKSSSITETPTRSRASQTKSVTASQTTSRASGTWYGSGTGSLSSSRTAVVTTSAQHSNSVTVPPPTLTESASPSSTRRSRSMLSSATLSSSATPTSSVAHSVESLTLSPSQEDLSLSRSKSQSVQLHSRSGSTSASQSPTATGTPRQSTSTSLSMRATMTLRSPTVTQEMSSSDSRSIGSLSVSIGSVSNARSRSTSVSPSPEKKSFSFSSSTTVSMSMSRSISGSYPSRKISLTASVNASLSFSCPIGQFVKEYFTILSSTQQSYDQCCQLCWSAGGDLASLRSRTEQAMAVAATATWAAANAVGLITGGNRRLDGKFRWECGPDNGAMFFSSQSRLNGSCTLFCNFAPGRPNGSGDVILFSPTRGWWYDADGASGSVGCLCQRYRKLCAAVSATATISRSFSTDASVSIKTASGNVSTSSWLTLSKGSRSITSSLTALGSHSILSSTPSMSLSHTRDGTRGSNSATPSRTEDSLAISSSLSASSTQLKTVSGVSPTPSISQVTKESTATISSTVSVTATLTPPRTPSVTPPRRSATTTASADSSLTRTDSPQGTFTVSLSMSLAVTNTYAPRPSATRSRTRASRTTSLSSSVSLLPRSHSLSLSQTSTPDPSFTPSLSPSQSSRPTHSFSLSWSGSRTIRASTLSHTAGTLEETRTDTIGEAVVTSALISATSTLTLTRDSETLRISRTQSSTWPSLTELPSVSLSFSPTHSRGTSSPTTTPSPTPSPGDNSQSLSLTSSGNNTSREVSASSSRSKLTRSVTKEITRTDSGPNVSFTRHSSTFPRSKSETTTSSLTVTSSSDTSVTASKSQGDMSATRRATRSRGTSTMSATYHREPRTRSYSHSRSAAARSATLSSSRGSVTGQATGSMSFATTTRSHIVTSRSYSILHTSSGHVTSTDSSNFFYTHGIIKRTQSMSRRPPLLKSMSSFITRSATASMGKQAAFPSPTGDHASSGSGQQNSSSSNDGGATNPVSLISVFGPQQQQQQAFVMYSCNAFTLMTDGILLLLLLIAFVVSSSSSAAPRRDAAYLVMSYSQEKKRIKAFVNQHRYLSVLSPCERKCWPRHCLLFTIHVNILLIFLMLWTIAVSDAAAAVALSIVCGAIIEVFYTFIAPYERLPLLHHREDESNGTHSFREEDGEWGEEEEGAETAHKSEPNRTGDEGRSTYGITSRTGDDSRSRSSGRIRQRHTPASTHAVTVSKAHAENSSNNYVVDSATFSFGDISLDEEEVAAAAFFDVAAEELQPPAYRVDGGGKGSTAVLAKDDDGFDFTIPLPTEPQQFSFDDELDLVWDFGEPLETATDEPSPPPPPADAAAERSRRRSTVGEAWGPSNPARDFNINTTTTTQRTTSPQLPPPSRQHSAIPLVIVCGVSIIIAWILAAQFAATACTLSGQVWPFFFLFLGDGCLGCTLVAMFLMWFA